MQRKSGVRFHGRRFLFHSALVWERQRKEKDAGSSGTGESRPAVCNAAAGLPGFSGVGRTWHKISKYLRTDCINPRLAQNGALGAVLAHKTFILFHRARRIFFLMFQKENGGYILGAAKRRCPQSLARVDKKLIFSIEFPMDIGYNTTVEF